MGCLLCYPAARDEMSICSGQHNNFADPHTAENKLSQRNVPPQKKKILKMVSVMKYVMMFLTSITVYNHPTSSEQLALETQYNIAGAESMPFHLVSNCPTEWLWSGKYEYC